MIKEEHHITLSIPNVQDFELFVQLIERAGFGIKKIDRENLTLECYIDRFTLLLTKNFLQTHIIYHNSIAAAKRSQSIAGTGERKLAG